MSHQRRRERRERHEAAVKWWQCALLVGALLGVADAVSEGRWGRAIAWLFLAGIWALLILLEWKKGRNQP